MSPSPPDTIARLSHDVVFLLLRPIADLTSNASPSRPTIPMHLPRYAIASSVAVCNDDMNTKKRELMISNFRMRPPSRIHYRYRSTSTTSAPTSTALAIPCGGSSALFADRRLVYQVLTIPPRSPLVPSANWWKREGSLRYRRARKAPHSLGANDDDDSQRHAWKTELQARLSIFDRHDRGCPTGASKSKSSSTSLVSEISKIGRRAVGRLSKDLSFPSYHHNQDRTSGVCLPEHAHYPSSIICPCSRSLRLRLARTLPGRRTLRSLPIL